MASVRTNQTMYNMLRQYRGKVDLDFAKMLWRFHGRMAKDPYSVVEFRDTHGRAWETICNLMNNNVNICIPDNGNNGKVYICTGPAGRVAEPYCEDPTIEYFQIGETHTFYELSLAATPRDSVNAARLTAMRYMTLAYQKLMYKDYGDVGFEGLDALFDQAKSEYWEGTNWTSRAALATGNDVLLYQAQALTAFTRSQCHSQRVYDALVKPPVTPSDLGLKKYKPYEYGF